MPTRCHATRAQPRTPPPRPRVILAQLEGSGRGALGAYNARAYSLLSERLLAGGAGEISRDPDAWLERVLDEDPALGGRARGGARGALRALFITRRNARVSRRARRPTCRMAVGLWSAHQWASKRPAALACRRALPPCTRSQLHVSDPSDPSPTRRRRPTARAARAGGAGRVLPGGV